VPCGDVFAGVLGVSAKNVVAIDLFGLEVLHRLEVLRQMNEAKFGPGRLGLCKQAAQ
jgi:hypothetical protein